MTISETILSIIGKRGITQKELAESIGISPKTLNTWLVCNYDSIPSRYVLPICEALSVSPLELLTGSTQSAHINTLGNLTSSEIRLVQATEP